MNEQEKYMKEAVKNAKKAFMLDEVPVGAIIVRNNEIIASTYNKKEKNKDSTAHAEILAIQEASKILQTPYLTDCDLYVTFEPCIMCTGAIINSRINKVIFGAYDHRYVSFETIVLQLNTKNINHVPVYSGGILKEECASLMTEYFKKKRVK